MADLEMLFKNTIKKNIALFQQGDEQSKGKAFKAVGKMKIRCLTSQEKKVLVVAGEMASGLGNSFYSQLGYDYNAVMMQAETIFVSKIINRE